MTLFASRSGASRPILAVAGLSASIFLLEVLLTRIFSVTLFNHFAFAAISLGMLGLASAGVHVSLAPRRFTREKAPDHVVLASALMVAGGTLAIGVIVQWGVFPLFSWDRVARLGVLYVLCLVPFYFGGLVLALLFTHHREEFAVLYAGDLLAAGAAGLMVFPLLRWFGGPSAVLVSLCLAGGACLAAFPNVRDSFRRAAWVALALAVAVVGADLSWGVLRLRRPKGTEVQGRVLFEGWNALSRVAVYDAPMWPWALAPRYTGPVAPGLRMDIDAAAATPIVSAINSQGNEYLLHELTALADRVAPKGRGLVIGTGGGRDALAALLSGIQRIDAVEINPIIVNEVMRGRFRGVSGGLYDDPRLSVHIADGRTFTRGSLDRFDLIQLSLVDTWAATAAGAFALSENNLYTLEATKEYIEHLTPEGVLTLTRWVGGETYRLVILVHEAARQLGITDVGRHMAVVGYPDETEARNVPVTLLFRKAPFDETTVAELRRHVEASGFVWLHDPLRAVPGRVSEMARADDALLEARRTENYELAPPTDDRPFFFFMPRPFVASVVEDPTRLFTEGQYLVSLVLALATLLSIAAIVVPLAMGAGGALRGQGGAALSEGPYFAALGVGFMLVEVSLMQRFVLYLGHPTHALTAVLAGLLIGAGLGSSFIGASQRTGASVSAGWLALGVATLLPVLSSLQGIIASRTLASPFPIKVLWTEATVLPLGVALGTLLPLGMARVGRRSPALVPWAWGMNGLASVVGACLAALLAMRIGFAGTFLLGAACYVVAALAAFACRDAGSAEPSP
ncbi:MAG: hypothetical protein ACHQNV_10300 [Vicinamibacteria bacterium]